MRNELAKSQGVESLTTFLEADAEHLPFADKSFDVVISSHVLEHLPDFDQGFRELCRVARKRVIVALPTGLNGCAMALLGGDHGYWKFGKTIVYCIALGIFASFVWRFWRRGAGRLCRT
jgi:ubiquinone/menaquinone biosynthesis C-methylase UbiE